MPIILKSSGFGPLIRMAEKYPAIAEKHVNNAIQRILVRIWGEEKKQAPVHTGNLRDNWTLQVARFSGFLRSNAPYGSAVHNGTRPHFVSGETLKAWAAKKGLNPWAVAANIKKKGTRANPFFQRAVDLQSDKVEQELQTALNAILNEVSHQ